jgi:hypothetical protein
LTARAVLDPGARQRAALLAGRDLHQQRAAHLTAPVSSAS